MSHKVPLLLSKTTLFLGYDTVGASNSNLFKKAGGAMEDFKPQELANSVWVYATAKVSNPKLFKKVADHIVRIDNLKSFNEQDCSNILWVFATVKESHQKLFKKVGDHVVKLDNLQSFKPHILLPTLYEHMRLQKNHTQSFSRKLEITLLSLTA